MFFDFKHLNNSWFTTVLNVLHNIFIKRLLHNNFFILFCRTNIYNPKSLIYFVKMNDLFIFFLLIIYSLSER